MTVKEIIKQYLETNGFDGLCNDDCGCSKDDLFPCGNIQEDCNPAFKCNCDHSCGLHSYCYITEKMDECWIKL